MDGSQYAHKKPKFNMRPLQVTDALDSLPDRHKSCTSISFAFCNVPCLFRLGLGSRTSLRVETCHSKQRTYHGTWPSFSKGELMSHSEDRKSLPDASTHLAPALAAMCPGAKQYDRTAQFVARSRSKPPMLPNT